MHEASSPPLPPPPLSLSPPVGCCPERVAVHRFHLREGSRLSDHERWHHQTYAGDTTSNCPIRSQHRCHMIPTFSSWGSAVTCSRLRINSRILSITMMSSSSLSSQLWLVKMDDYNQPIGITKLVGCTFWQRSARTDPSTYITFSTVNASLYSLRYLQHWASQWLYTHSEASADIAVVNRIQRMIQSNVRN